MKTCLPTVLVLASGRGERFRASGGQGSKLQALLAGRPVLDRTLDAVRASGLPWHVEQEGHAGMADSIAAAVRATRSAAGWLVLPGDLPLMRADTLRAVAQALVQHDTVVPVYLQQPGHPVGFSSGLGHALETLSGPGGAASVLKLHPPYELHVSDVGCIMDIDTVADLAMAERRLTNES